MARVSPAGTIANHLPRPLAAGGGSAFYVGWGVHGAGTSGPRSSRRSRPADVRGADADAHRDPHSDSHGHRDRDPHLSPSATPTVTPAPHPPRSVPVALARPRPPRTRPARPPPAIADFTTLPAATKCVRGRKLTVRFKNPPKGYTVKTVTVKVNAKKVATLKGAKLKQPLYLRKLPTGRSPSPSPSP